MRIGRASRVTRVPANAPAVTSNCRGVRPRAVRGGRRPPDTIARNPDAAYRSERTTRSAAKTKSQSRARKPALVSCSTNSGTRGRRSRARVLLRAEDEAGVPHPDHVAIAQLPGLHRVAVDGGAVGGAEVRQRGRLTVPADLQVPARHAGVGQP